MRNIMWADFRKLTKGKVTENLPLCVNTEDRNPEGWRQIPFLVVGRPEEIIILSDLHPVMQAKLRNIELQARSAMPKQPEETIVVDSKGEVSIEVK